jgi:hypothetical protein
MSQALINFAIMLSPVFLMLVAILIEETFYK